MEKIQLLDPSPGQQRVREIVEQMFVTHPEIDISLETQDEIYDHLYHSLENDPIVTRDKLTGSAVTYTEMSKNYLDWHKATINKQTSSDIIIDYNRLITEGSTTGEIGQDPNWPIYRGGRARKNITARALFTLGTGRHVTAKEFSINYFINSGLTEVRNGNHRALAYRLYGVTNLPPDIETTIFDDYNHNEQLNRDLLDIEKNLDTQNIMAIEPLSARTLANFLQENPEHIRLVFKFIERFSDGEKIKVDLSRLLQVVEIQRILHTWFIQPSWKRRVLNLFPQQRLSNRMTKQQINFYNQYRTLFIGV